MNQDLPCVVAKAAAEEYTWKVVCFPSRTEPEGDVWPETPGRNSKLPPGRAEGQAD